jgi:hypothetical protein
MGGPIPQRLRSAWRWLLALWRGFPRTMRAGIVVVWLGFLVDTAAHLAGRRVGGDRFAIAERLGHLSIDGIGGGFTLAEHLGHVIGIAGMLLTLVGITLQRSQHR